MKLQNSLIEITQIYDFIKERPGFSNKTQAQKFQELLIELNEENHLTLKYPSFLGRFGKKTVINVRNAPDFDDKIKLISWICKQFSE